MNQRDRDFVDLLFCEHELTLRLYLIWAGGLPGWQRRMLNAWLVLLVERQDALWLLAGNTPTRSSL